MNRNQHNRGIFSEYFSGERPSLSSIFTFSDISDKTQAHLTKVYTMIMACSVVCALGMYVNGTVILSGFFMTILSIILSVYLMIQVSNRSHPEQTRMLYLGGLAF